MFYDSDDDDDDHFVFGFNGYGEYAFGGFRLDFGDWLDFGGYDSDDYNNDYFEDSDDSDFSYSSDKSYDDFYEVCHSPSLFPDAKKFPVEFARRVSKIRSAHKDPLQDTPYYHSVTEKLDIPIFEQLWECLFYVKQIVCVGLDRVEIPSETSDVNKGIVKMWNSSIDCISALHGTANEMCNHCFVWCNDLLIESLQSLIPFTIPYTAWESIVFHLSTDPHSISKTRTLFTQIGTISKDSKAQIVERFLVRECILRSADLTRVLYRILYSRQSDLNVDKIKQKLPLLLNGFNSSMERFMCFLDSSEPSSKCINHSVGNQFSLYINDHLDQVPDLTQEESDILKMVGASAGYQNGADHFTMFIVDGEEPGEEDLYHLLCIDKNCIDTEENASFIFVSGALRSDQPPLMFSCEGLVAGIGFEDSNIKTLTVWDVSDEGPFKGRGENIFSSDFEKMTSSWKKIDPGFNSSFFLNDDVNICGIAKFDKTIKLMFSIMPFCPEASGRSPSCMIAEYDLDEFSSKFSFFKPKLQQSYFPNAMPLGIHKNMAFVMHLETNTLYVYDINQAYKVVITKTSFECGKDWKIQFNSNADAKSCLLYKGNYLQIRELDEELTLVNELTLDLDHLSQLYNSFEFQFCDSILYGFLNHQENLHITQNKFLACEALHDDTFCDDFLNKRFADAHMVHFLVDLDSEDKELYYLDFDDNASECAGIVDGITNYASVDIQFCLTGFNKRGELVQLSMELDVEEVDFDGDKAIAMCPSFEFATVKFYESFKDMTNLMLPDVEQVITKHKKEVAEREAIKKREEERMEKLRKETEERDRKREARKAKEEQRKQRKWQQRIQAEKDRKAAEVERSKSSAQGSSKDSELVVKLKEHIASGTVFTSTISTWLPYKHYGFSTVDVEKGKQSVFVHESCIVNNERRNVKTGSSIQFQLRWNQIHPRPKAVNVKLL